MIWKPLPGFEGLYEASDTGLVKSLARVVENSHTGYKSGKRTVKERIIKPSKKGNLTLCKDGIIYYYKIAQVILLAHRGPPPSDNEYNARHLNDDQSNNNLENLCWGSAKDNHNDGTRNGRHASKGTIDALKYGEKLRGIKRPNVDTRRKNYELLVEQTKNRPRSSRGRFT